MAGRESSGLAKAGNSGYKVSRSWLSPVMAACRFSAVEPGVTASDWKGSNGSTQFDDGLPMGITLDAFGRGSRPEQLAHLGKFICYCFFCGLRIALGRIGFALDGSITDWPRF